MDDNNQVLESLRVIREPVRQGLSAPVLAQARLDPKLRALNDTRQRHLEADDSVRVLDLFCGAGGAAMGYHNAGFEVVGVDIAPQPRYPFEFIQVDALEMLKGVIAGRQWTRYKEMVADFDVIHASPPCQAYSVLNGRNKKVYPELIEPTRALLQLAGLPYVIENVAGAPLVDPIILCGTMFNLGTGEYELQRHRLFELGGFRCRPPGACQHHRPVVGVYGGHARDRRRSTGKSLGIATGKVAMDIDWMTSGELSEAIPPAYTEYIGTQFIQHTTARFAA